MHALASGHPCGKLATTAAAAYPIAKDPRMGHTMEMMKPGKLGWPQSWATSSLICIFQLEKSAWNMWENSMVGPSKWVHWALIFFTCCRKCIVNAS